ncbi:MAG: hypothetical protein QNK37_32885 [Acidobacteriota bacterium]|nr:hypothetical protein [Acidobacteriota bacterium]
MGLSTLNVYVSKMDDPCGISDRTWYVTVYDCSGKVFQWCNRKYVLIPARCGHVQIKLPPGCYYLKAVWGFTVIRPGSAYRVNHFTDAGIVTLCCDSHQCIKLFNPSAHRCGYIYVRAIRDLVKQKVIKRELAKQTINLLEQVIEGVGGPETFEMGHEKEINKLLRQRLKEEKDGNEKPERPSL